MQIKGSDNLKIDSSILKMLRKVKKYRRALHKIPELAFLEFKTIKYIKSVLIGLGYTPIDILPTGIKVVITIPNAQKTIAIRADIDALPLQEPVGCAFGSKHKDRMHACGHDGHSAILLALSEYIMNHKDNLKHNVVLIFQPAEEGAGGAFKMIDAGVLNNPNVDLIYTSHLSPLYEQGTINISTKTATAGDYPIDIIIKGKSAHAASPHQGTDAIVTMAQLINMLQCVVSRKNNPQNPLVFTIGTAFAGKKRNIIADEAFMECTIRAFDKKNYQDTVNNVKQICFGLKEASGCEINVVEKPYFNPVINHPLAIKDLLSAFYQNEIDIIPPQTFAEDFFAYLDVCPGALFIIGIKNHEKGYTNALHSVHFNFDERALLTGLEVYRRILFNKS